MQMLGYNSAYVPGWDCHGLPIEWKIEEQYRAKGKNKDDVPLIEFRAECRSFAQHWIDVQREEFKRLGVLGDWNNPYLTMSFDAEAQIARELMKVAASGQLYRGSKPVMWSVVERTALAEAEIEYADYESDTIWVKFPIHSGGGEITSNAFHDLNASVLIWTTTPWTIPANRAIAYSSKIAYGLYEVTKAPENNWASTGEKYVIADKLATDVFAKAKVETFARIGDVNPAHLTSCLHPLHGLGGGYEFEVPLLDGEHVTDDTGTGFVHTAPGHGLDDFEIWLKSSRMLAERGIDTAIPFVVDDAGFYTKEAPRLRRRPGARRFRQEGRRQQPRHRGARRAGHDGRPRPGQAPVPAFLAVEEAGDLPEYAAVVRLHGPADCPLIRPCGPPSPRRGEEHGRRRRYSSPRRGEGGSRAARDG